MKNRILGALLPCAVCLVSSAAYADGVTVATGKEGYAIGEPVAITLTNGSDHPIWSLAKSATPGSAVRNLEVRNPRGIWDAFFLKNRKGSDAEFETAGEIKPGETVTFSWKPAVLEKGRERAPGAGRYRLSVIYHVKKSAQTFIFGTAKSNEFSLK
jgi:hypothetical protein